MFLHKIGALIAVLSDFLKLLDILYLEKYTGFIQYLMINDKIMHDIRQFMQWSE